MLAKYADVDRSFFYRKNTVDALKYAKEKEPYQYMQPKESAKYSIKEEIKEFVTNPENERYLLLAKELSEKKIDVDYVRQIILV